MHIAISGNIGSGKTTLTRKLSSHYGWRAEYELVDDNPYLADFYADMNRWAFHLQVYFLNSRFNTLQKIKKSELTVILDRTIDEDANIFAKNLYESKLMSECDYENYCRLFQSLIQHVHAPDLLIYLRSEIPKLVKQIKLRGRNYELDFPLDYLMNLNECYEDWISNYDKGKLLIIDVNEVDFVANKEDFLLIVEKVNSKLDLTS